ncbi:glycoside hydrolase family 43 protein [Pseudoxanthomonas sp. 10H]|uniref:glycoside hydrolase family 43 protein n=1 Tax=Pseudoxanthomonas sp. 10H TaxID=3242729 RepID=UPI003557BBA4
MPNAFPIPLSLGICLAAAAACVPASATPSGRYANPILFADYSDPDVIRVGGDYVMVASTFHFSPGLPVLKSKDLVHWTLVGHALPRLPFGPAYDLPGPLDFDDASARARLDPAMGHRYSAGVWAPCIRHHDGRWFIYFATPTDGIFMVSAERPEGPWSAPVALVAQAGFEDPTPFWDDDGSAWLLHSKVGAGPLILRRMTADGTRVLDAGTVIVEDPVNLPVLEGPKLLKRNGWYYIFAPYGGVEKGPQAVLRARDIRGPYEWRTVLAQGDTDVQAPHQGGYVETPSGEGWFVHFNSTGAYGRIVHLQPVRWVDDWPLVGEPVSSTTGQPVPGHAMPDVGRDWPAIRPQASDGFDTRVLGPQWEWNHNPVDSHWSLAARPGHLRLTAMYAPGFLAARNTLTQVHHGSASRTTVRMDVSAMRDGERAGLAMLQVQPNWIGVAREGGHRHLVFAAAGVETRGPRADGTVVQLRQHVADQRVHYEYSLDDGRSFHSLGATSAMRFSWWKGARPALFTWSSDAHAAARGHVDVDRVEIETLAPLAGNRAAGSGGQAVPAQSPSHHAP